MIKLLSISLAMLAATFAGKLFAQELPGTDVWLARIANGLPSEPIKIYTGDSFTLQTARLDAKGSKLYKRSPGDSRWELMADLKTFGINHISRLAINLKSKQIALVSDHVITAQAAH